MATVQSAAFYLELLTRNSYFVVKIRILLIYDTVQQTVKAVAELGDKRMVLGNHFTHAIADLGLFSTGLTMRNTSSGR